VLDSQLGLMPESDLPGDIRRVLRQMDGPETVMVAGQRGIQVTGTSARLAGPWDTDATLHGRGLSEGWQRGALGGKALRRVKSGGVVCRL
jgi:hypothetical protein